MNRFTGKTALITGGTSGIGREIAILFAREGAQVVFCGRHEERGRQVEDWIRQQGGWATFVRCDITQEAEVATLVEQTITLTGRLDIAINNAGISPKRSLVTEISYETYQTVMNTNLWGVMLGLKYQIQAMQTLKAGVILNIASVLGIKAYNLNHALYTASKHAVVGLTKAAALEYASTGIRINALCPGGVDTEIHHINLQNSESKQALIALHPLKRLARTQEIAQAAAFLCSDEALFITGICMPVDGGATL